MVLVAPQVNPSAQRTKIILWSVFNMLACAGFLSLFLARLCSRRKRWNWVLLNLEFAFFVATAGCASLTWTGHIMERETPFGLCLVSGAFLTSMSTAQTGSAFALVCKAWAHAMRLNHPGSDMLIFLSSTSVLVLVPWLVTIPAFFATLALGLADHSNISRTSPFYCLSSSGPINTFTLVFDIIFEVGSLLLAVWTSSLVARTHWRARALRSTSEGGLSYYPLIIRTLVFTALLLIACGSNISLAVVGYSAAIPDLITSALSFLAVFVFGTDPGLLAAFRSRKPPPAVASAITFIRESAARLSDGDDTTRASAHQLASHEMLGRKAPSVTLDLSAQDSVGFKILVEESMAGAEDESTTKS